MHSNLFQIDKTLAKANAKTNALQREIHAANSHDTTIHMNILQIGITEKHCEFRKRDSRVTYFTHFPQVNAMHCGLSDP